MSLLKSALELAKLGHHVFPLIPNSKLPAIEDFPNQATTDPAKIKAWWKDRPYNIGISTTRFNGTQALIVVDVDNKGKKKGHEEILRLELGGFEFIETSTQVTPTDGVHLIYRAKEPVKQGTDVLAVGLDIRSKGGYIVGPGSVLDGKTYRWKNHLPPAECPKWIIEKCGAPIEKIKGRKFEVDEKNARIRAEEWLKVSAPLAEEGASGDQTTFFVAAKMKDFGLDPVDCIEILATNWNQRCSPPWSHEELAVKVENAYRYGTSPQGVNSPEADFGGDSTNPLVKITASSPVVHPVGELNKEFSFLTKNSEIIWETTDHKNQKDLLYLTVTEFHNHLLSKTLIDGSGKFNQISKLWLRSPIRRSYTRTCFYPGKTPPPQFYNLWTGFSVEDRDSGPADAELALANFLDHILKNICSDNVDHFNWVIGYFAHLIQKPFEKPRTCIVMKGRKGTGKNIVSKCIGKLIEGHHLVVANRRYLTGNFNAHLERLLLLTLDEAFWSGDKATEGVLKDLVTGDTHLIERKGQEAYPVDNLTRLIVIGNEDWVVPASEDERRYAVFNVGEDRRGDQDFFGGIVDGMNNGGAELLLHYLKNFDLKKTNINLIPMTKGLLEQKTATLGHIQLWWFEALKAGQLENVGSEMPWPSEIDRNLLQNAIKIYLDARNVRSWTPSSTQIGNDLRRMCPGITGRQKRIEAVSRVRTYVFPTLLEARLDWEHFIGHRCNWDEDSIG